MGCAFIQMLGVCRKRSGDEKSEGRPARRRRKSEVESLVECPRYQDMLSTIVRHVQSVVPAIVSDLGAIVAAYAYPDDSQTFALDAYSYPDTDSRMFALLSELKYEQLVLAQHPTLVPVLLRVAIEIDCTIESNSPQVNQERSILAFRHYLRAAELGDPHARLYVSEWRPTDSERERVNLWRRQASSRIAELCLWTNDHRRIANVQTWLGSLGSQGDTYDTYAVLVRMTARHTAAGFFLTAVVASHQLACSALFGRPVDVDEKKFVDGCLRQAAEAGDPRALQYLGRDAADRGEHAEAFRAFALAADAHYVPSMAEAAWYALGSKKQVVPVDKARANRWLRDSADLSTSSAKLLAECLEKARRVQQD